MWEFYFMFWFVVYEKRRIQNPIKWYSMENFIFSFHLCAVWFTLDQISSVTALNTDILPIFSGVEIF